MYGVSPAFILSKYGQSFTVDQFLNSLDHIKRLGFSGFQPEIFRIEELNKWYNGGAQRVAERARQIGLDPTQFVAHFLLDSFSSEENLFSDFGISELKKVIEITDRFENCDTIVVPVGLFKFDKRSRSYTDLKTILFEKMASFLKIITSADKRFAIEIMPYSIVEGIGGFLELYDKLNSNKFGISVDTGHAWACRELVELLPLKLRGKVFGLHLCDNDSNVNISLSPGKGTINWREVISNLINSGYKGSYDIEILCSAEKIDDEYSYGLNTIKYLVEKNGIN